MTKFEQAIWNPDNGNAKLYFTVERRKLVPYRMDDRDGACVVAIDLSYETAMALREFFNAPSEARKRGLSMRLSGTP